MRHTARCSPETIGKCLAMVGWDRFCTLYCTTLLEACCREGCGRLPASESCAGRSTGRGKQMEGPHTQQNCSYYYYCVAKESRSRLDCTGSATNCLLTIRLRYGNGFGCRDVPDDGHGLPVGQHASARPLRQRHCGARRGGQVRTHAQPLVRPSFPARSPPAHTT